jgi:hypothetical protein
MFSLALAHFDQIGESAVQGAIDCRPGFFGIEGLFGKTHDARGLQDRADRDFARGVQLLLQCTHGFMI